MSLVSDEKTSVPAVIGSSALEHAPVPDRIASVLVIEDNDTTRGRMAGVLTAAGYRVVEAVEGRDALMKALATPFDTILLDLVMPQVDGWQFRETQLRHPALACIPTIVVTVRPLRAPDRYVLRATDVVLKPFEEHQLLEAVSRAVAASRASRSAPAPADLSSDQLFWSQRGEVACRQHAPTGDSDRWLEERWAAIPSAAHKHGIRLQCQYCPGHDGPIHHPPAARR